MHRSINVENELLFENCRTAYISAVLCGKEFQHSKKLDNLARGRTELWEDNNY